ncbi:MAG: long-chain-fatty-acid--CoA ligase [Gammaproteobacteria bacterium]|nr:long-chain-fatty-acid--CoA ligase [Gammaproteobacteria bacterium]MBI5616120.1 long-chain-fatty-acid--CoA ligase [Gammaproteobacteria bacterium]
MFGLMMDLPLLVTRIMRHAERNHPRQEVVAITADMPSFRYTYADCFARVRKLANALDALGTPADARVGTLAWNDHRHLELYFAIACSGRVCHTINPRLFDEQLLYIINHAEDEWLFVDPAFVPKLEELSSQCPKVKGYIVLTDAAHMPNTTLPNAMCYEELLAPHATTYEWPALDERTACGLCYTSGTTGNPKGVLYNHRSTMLLAYAQAMPDVSNLSARDCVMPIVPMFHVNAWAYPFAVTNVGGKLVFPGQRLGDAAQLTRLVNEEGVTVTAAVPTVALAILNHAREPGRTLAPLKRFAIGGSACPLTVIEEFRDRHGVEVLHAWGMTEMSPLGTLNQHTMLTAKYEGERLREHLQSAGRAIPGVELKITDDDDKELPWDGKAFGSLKVRGLWVCRDYYKLEGSGGSHADGWFTTGDVASIDEHGFMRITDRAKDVIKSGGEWISSIDLENAAVAHPMVAEAAVIGVTHPTWQERPLLVIVPERGMQPTREELLAWFEGKVAKWWIPDDVVFVENLPHTATGKISKLELRKRLQDYRFPSA